MEPATNFFQPDDEYVGMSEVDEALRETSFTGMPLVDGDNPEEVTYDRDSIVEFLRTVNGAEPSDGS